MAYGLGLETGSLRDRVDVQSPVVIGQSETNQDIISWAYRTTRWAEVIELSGAEAVKARALQEEVTHQITMRSGFKMFSGYRIIHSGKVINITSAVEQIDRVIMLGVHVVGDDYIKADLTASATLQATGSVS